MRSSSVAPCASNTHSSTFVAWEENREKLTPRPSQVAPRGLGSPSRSLYLELIVSRQVSLSASPAVAAGRGADGRRAPTAPYAAHRRHCRCIPVGKCAPVREHGGRMTRSRKILVTVLVIVAVLVAARLALPTVVEDYV